MNVVGGVSQAPSPMVLVGVTSTVMPCTVISGPVTSHNFPGAQGSPNPQDGGSSGGGGIHHLLFWLSLQQSPLIIYGNVACGWVEEGKLLGSLKSLFDRLGLLVLSPAPTPPFMFSVKLA